MSDGNQKYIFEYFPEEYIALNKEMASGHHPDLERIIQVNGGDSTDIDLKLAQTAAYCEVVLDGVYELDSRVNLCKILLQRLILKRKPLPGETSQIILSN
jgi:hypothetical protein